MIVRRSARRRQTGETGAILPFLALGFVAITLFLIMTVDVGVGYMARGQLQNIADAASRAALEMRTDNGMSPAEAQAAATNFAQQMTAANGIPGAQVIFGDYDFASNMFRPGGTELNPAVRVVASRMAAGPSGANSIPGLLQDIDVSASSTAMFKCRAIVIAEDVSASFGPGIPGAPAGNEIELAKDALETLVTEMAEQALPGDHIGLVTFARNSDVLLNLTPLPQAVGQLTGPGGIIDSIQACNSLDCDGTDQAAGINAALDVHTASPCNGVVDRLIIVVSDGQPCGENTQDLRQQAMQAVAAARGRNISVSSVFYDNPRATDSCAAEPDSAGVPPAQFSESLVTGDLGRSFVTPDARAIEGLLLDILKLFRVSVVG
jgi:Mg-chelatase subunit ChlD